MDALPFDLRFERLINDFLEGSYAVSNELFNKEEIDLLRKYALREDIEDNFRLAGIGDRFNFQKEKSIRSDKILWLNREEARPAEQVFFQLIDQFINYLNISCYAGIRRSEFHYAIYEPGTFYERHSDQFKGDDRRKFSMVLYLTENWKEGDGGELIIYKKGQSGKTEESIVVRPTAGRLVFFDSSLEHEVLLSKAQRVSLTGWLRTH